MDEVVDGEDIQQVVDPSEQYGGSWDNQRVGGTELDDAEPVRVEERYRETADGGVVMDTREGEDTDSGVEGQGSMQDGECERIGSIVRHDNGSRERAGSTTYVGRRSGRDADWWCIGAGALLCWLGVTRRGGRHLGRRQR